jgi:hypothetical protein
MASVQLQMADEIDVTALEMRQRVRYPVEETLG